jgi:hypothetical protein
METQTDGSIIVSSISESDQIFHNELLTKLDNIMKEKDESESKSDAAEKKYKEEIKQTKTENAMIRAEWDEFRNEMRNITRTNNQVPLLPAQPEPGPSQNTHREQSPVHNQGLFSNRSINESADSSTCTSSPNFEGSTP